MDFFLSLSRPSLQSNQQVKLQSQETFSRRVLQLGFPSCKVTNSHMLDFKSEDFKSQALICLKEIGTTQRT